MKNALWQIRKTNPIRVGCLEVMDNLSGKVTDRHFKTIEDFHKRLTGTMGGRGVKDLDHLAVIRNIMAHNYGVAEDYHDLLKPDAEASALQKRRMRAIRRAMNENAGIKVDGFNKVLMDSGFLAYSTGEFARYAGELKSAVQLYHHENSLAR